MNKKGFTLIELLIVVAIIGIIAAIAIPNLLVALQKGKQKATMGDMKSVGNAVESYITDWSFAPQVGTNVTVDNLAVAWFEPFYIKILPKQDGWGTLFRYTVVGAINTDDQDVYNTESYGRNKIDGPVPGDALYDVTAISDFNFDIVFSNGFFTQGPRVKK